MCIRDRRLRRAKPSSTAQHRHHQDPPTQPRLQRSWHTYPNAIWDEDEQRLVSDAEVAEAFTSRRKADHISARLIVRRVKLAQADRELILEPAGFSRIEILAATAGVDHDQLGPPQQALLESAGAMRPGPPWSAHNPQQWPLEPPFSLRSAGH